MRKSVKLVAVVVLGLAAACSSSKSNTTPTGLDAGALGAGKDAGGGGGGGDSATVCATYQANIDKNAPNCQAGAPAGTFEAACHQVVDSLKTCVQAYEAVLECQAAGAKCDNGKITLGACDAETSAYSTCGTSTPDAGDDGASTCTVAKGAACAASGSCCADGLICSNTTPSPTDKVCCVGLKGTCASADDCCQTTGGTADCELALCCLKTGGACSTAKDCCGGALCINGACGN